MPPAELLQRLRANPFRPFRIVMTDGTSYDIRHRDFLMVGLASAVVGVPAEEDVDLYRITHQISLRHVIRLEPLEEAAAAASEQHG